MTDYRCPSCDGGFPASHDDGCPWCGEAMDGANTSDSDVSTPHPWGDSPARINDIVTSRDRPNEILQRSREPSIDNSDNPLTGIRWRGGRGQELDGREIAHDLPEGDWS